MALTASRTTAGFELVGNKLGLEDPGVYYRLTPNTAFSKGDMVVLTNGMVAKAAANATNVLGVMAQSFTTVTNPTAGETYGLVYDNPYNIYLCTFADHRDSTATGGTTLTLLDTALSTSSDDVWNGAYLYVYDGTNKGISRTVYDYTGGSDTLTFAKAAGAAYDTTSKYILLGVGTAGDVINVGSFGVDLKDENTIDANATIGSEAGPLLVVEIVPRDLMMKVMIRKHLYNN